MDWQPLQKVLKPSITERSSVLISQRVEKSATYCLVTPLSLLIEHRQHQIYLNRVGKRGIQSRNFIVYLATLRPPPGMFLANSKIARAVPETFYKVHHMCTVELQLRKIHSNLTPVEYYIKCTDDDPKLSVQEAKVVAKPTEVK
jgi:hypothetical protein